ncbi:hypothetical protein MAPG_09351 [Magnaporthiopsis poae ATCC 64411]|uniref:Heterokaryon incompatibility domain-containing protein n=1 Tax=Magnaporthiopsis poae (strain ATCC 64411 / 73-15) TaxID=644358 RepID=A0A0C4E9Q5_MAGP6|nr:hypothetical protein MAPG_09351 [Magnaporthiopsis poae ATCC 64411]
MMNEPKITGQVCEQCRSAISEAYKLAVAAEPGYGPWVVLSPSFTALEESAASGGCDVCRIARRRIICAVHPLANLEENAPIIVWWFLASPPLEGYDTSVAVSSLQLRIQLVDSKGTGSFLHDELCFLRDELDGGLAAKEENEEAGGKIIDGFEDDQEFGHLMATIKGWIEACDNTHQWCRRGLQTAQPERVLPRRARLPTHLIDVRPDDAPDSIRLVEGSSCGPGASYATLSYCWGKSGRNLKTTRSNLGAMAREIPWPRLPQTVKDAVAVTRRLGIRHLWVDALCIVQQERPNDPGSDWAVEATRMGSYYANAACTLAASSAEDCADGFLCDRPACRLPPGAPVSVDFDDVFLGRRSRLRSPGRLVPDPKAAMERSALLRRGWCVQERALSARILYFARDAVFWECDELRAVEDRPDRHLAHGSEALQHAIPLGQYWGQRVGPWDLLGSGLSGLARELEGASQTRGLVEMALGASWMNMLERYSFSQFSFASDKLVALSSIATMLGYITGGTYIAGHWIETLGRSLLWSVSYAWSTVEQAAAPRQQKNDKRRDAPSWSWVSVDWAVAFHGLDDGSWEQTATIGHLPPSSASRSQPVMRPPAIRITGLFCTQTLQQWALRPMGDIKIKYWTGSKARCVMWDAAPDLFNAQTRLACIIIGVQKISEHAQDTFAIVLQPTGNAQDGVEEFVRTGLLCFENLDVKSIQEVANRTIDII